MNKLYCVKIEIDDGETWDFYIENLKLLNNMFELILNNDNIKYVHIDGKRSEKYPGQVYLKRLIK